MQNNVQQSAKDFHTPVLLKEVLDILQPKDGAFYLDATFGAGGYTKAILNAAKCNVVAIDKDEGAQDFYQLIKNDFDNRLSFYSANFSQIKKIAPRHKKFDGIVFDIGVSTMQLKTASRGFSFANEGPLDMRMSKKITIDANMIVNSFSQEQIANIIYNLGGETKSRKIAKAIVDQRKKQEIKTTTQLAKIVHDCFPIRYYKIDPATKTFQALRIFVNQELEELKKGLDQAASLIAKDGKIIVVSFHSLEDRIVKHAFRDLKISEQGFEIINKKVITPCKKELEDNPSSRSAKLRAIKKL